MTRAEFRQSTIDKILPNIKLKWPDLANNYTDNQIAACYEDFSMSEDAGDNDKEFESWFSEIKNYPKEFN